MKTKIFTYLRILISLALLGLLIFLMRGKYQQILAELKKTNLPLFGLAFGLFCLNISINTLRLNTLLMSEKLSVPFGKLIQLSYIGFFFNNFMPSAIGGDIIKAYYAGIITKNKSKAYLSIFMDRLTGLFSFAIIGVIALTINWNTVSINAVKISVLVFVLLCAVVALILLNATLAKFISNILSKIHVKNIGNTLLKVYQMLRSYKNRKAVLIRAILLSVISQVSYFTLIFVLFRSVHTDISYFVVFIIMPLVCVITLLPSLGGLGLREGAIVAFFGPQLGNEVAFGVSILLYVILLLTSLIGGIIYLTSPQFRTIKIKEKEDLI